MIAAIQAQFSPGFAEVAQTDRQAVAADSKAASKSTFTVGTQYATNASGYGQKAEEKTPYIAAVASYHPPIREGCKWYAAYRLLKRLIKNWLLHTLQEPVPQ